ncbi:hypothetical protein CVT24_012744 [Panaeolus cyanescens]|uniref:Uncharacterized protein n=1 Tax=Panaeolus cyanescens TaxID=181874 RepID=A0A409WUP3_9AGAR|nr:hypothetical protein CVT24_012744 [Panaeolus cyanescens]
MKLMSKRLRGYLDRNHEGEAGDTVPSFWSMLEAPKDCYHVVRRSNNNQRSPRLVEEKEPGTYKEVKFEKVLGEGRVRALDSKLYEGHQAFDMGTRYFTDRDDAPTQEHVRFKEEVDPLFILELVRKSQFIHTEDNAVQYCAKQEIGHARKRYVPDDASAEGHSQAGFSAANGEDEV